MIICFLNSYVKMGLFTFFQTTFNKACTRVVAKLATQWDLPLSAANWGDLESASSTVAPLKAQPTEKNHLLALTVRTGNADDFKWATDQFVQLLFFKLKSAKQVGCILFFYSSLQHKYFLFVWLSFHFWTQHSFSWVDPMWWCLDHFWTAE